MDPRYGQLAEVLCEFSTRLKKGENVLIDAHDVPEDFVIALIRAAREHGATPMVNLHKARVGREMIKAGTKPQFKLAADHELARMKKMQAYIAVRGSDNIFEGSDIPSSQAKLNGDLMRPVLDHRVNKTKWVVLRWPNSSMAQQAKMSTEAFADFYFRLYQGDGAINKVSLNLGLWSSIHDKNAGAGTTQNWYEFDYTIGLAVTLGHLGRIQAGTHRLETAVGVVTFDYDGGNRVSLDNVPSYRFATGVSVDVDGVGKVTGDIAWGGNWFFLVDSQLQPGRSPDQPLVGTRSDRSGHPVAFGIADVEALSDLTKRIRRALQAAGITGAEGGEIDHIELFGPPGGPENHSRNFVLCPGGAYDRSPCGTGTSAKLACLYAAGKLSPGQTWRQESILGSVFEGSVRLDGDNLIPRVSGTAHVIAEATLLLDPNDPFQMGIRS